MNMCVSMSKSMIKNVYVSMCKSMRYKINLNESEQVYEQECKHVRP